MADDSNSGGTGSGAGTPPPATTDPGKTQEPGNSGAPGAGGAEDWFEKLSPEVQEEVKKLRSEAAYRRKAAKEAETKAQELQAKIDAEEAEKLKKQGEYQKLYEGEQQKFKGLQSKLIEQELKLHAQKAGILDLEVAKLISSESVKFNDLGEITGAEEAVATFKQSKPHLFAQPASTTQPATTPPPKTTSAGNEPPKPAAGANTKTVLELSEADYKKERAAFLRS